MMSTKSHYDYHDCFQQKKEANKKALQKALNKLNEIYSHSQSRTDKWHDSVPARTNVLC